MWLHLKNSSTQRNNALERSHLSLQSGLAVVDGEGFDDLLLILLDETAYRLNLRDAPSVRPARTSKASETERASHPWESNRAQSLGSGERNRAQSLGSKLRWAGEGWDRARVASLGT